MPFRAVMLAAALAASAAGPAAPAPERVVGPGVRHVVVERDGLHADVAVIEAGAPVELRAVVAGGGVGSGLERTSAMCARVDCLVAVNGDFTFPGTHQPVGGVIRDGILVKSPSPDHHQLLVGRDGSLAAGRVDLRARLVATDLEPLDIGVVNGPREDGSLVLYTPAFGTSTRTNAHGAELSIRLLTPGTALVVGQTSAVEAATFAEGAGDAPIPHDGAVLSGHGRAAERLAALWKRVETGELGRTLLLRLDAEPDAWQSIGGTPVLLRDGDRWFADDGSAFVAGRHPRTAVGWNDRGETFLLTVDGRQPGHSDGASLAELADLLVELGATEAVNLDGGGSTTFVVGGEVSNRPSDRLVERNGDRRIVNVPRAGDVVVGPVERPSTTALAVVHRGTGDPAGDPFSDAGLDLPTLDLPPPTASDPASVPGGHLPALVGSAAPRHLDPGLPAVAVVALTLAVLGVGLHRQSRRGRAGGRRSSLP